MKVFKRGASGQEELEKYKRLGEGDPDHPGYDLVSKVLFQAKLPRPGGSHFAIGLEPMWSNISVLQSRWPDNRLRVDVCCKKRCGMCSQPSTMYILNASLFTRVSLSIYCAKKYILAGFVANRHQSGQYSRVNRGPQHPRAV